MGIGKMNKFPTKFRVLIKSDKLTNLSTELTKNLIYKSLDNIEYRLDGYKMKPGEEIGWYFGNTTYLFCFTKDHYHNLCITMTDDYVIESIVFDYPEIKNLASILRTRKKPIRVLKNIVNFDEKHTLLEEIQRNFNANA